MKKKVSMKLYPFKQSVYVPSNIGMSLFGLAYRQMGGFFETPGIRGTSHLMEHLMCKPFDHMREQLKALGISHNAYTSDNQVVFYFSGLTESLREVCDELYNKITKQTTTPWTKEAFETEKNTVLQEYGDTFNSQESGFYYNLMRRHYGYCGAIGYKSDIESFSYEQSLIRSAEFTLPNIICQVGEEFVKIPKYVSSGMGDGAFTDEPILYTSKNPPQIQFGEPHDLIQETIPKDDKTLVGLLGCNPTNASDTQMMGFIINCINGGLESPLYEEIREKRGLSYYSVGEAVYVGERCLPMFFASTTDENVKSLENIYKNFFDMDAKDVISEARFNTCKKAYAVKQRVADILPHSGAQTTVLGDINPFDGVSEFTYDMVLDKYNSLMRIENYIPVKY